MAREAAGQLEQHRAGMALHGHSERQEQHVLAVALVAAGGGGGGGRGGRRGGGAGPRRVVAPRGRSLAPSVLLSLLVGLQRVFFAAWWRRSAAHAEEDDTRSGNFGKVFFAEV